MVTAMNSDEATIEKLAEGPWLFNDISEFVDQCAEKTDSAIIEKLIEETKSGSAEAAFYLGMLNIMGIGSPVDVWRGNVLIQLAAKNGNPKAMLVAGYHAYRE